MRTVRVGQVNEPPSIPLPPMGVRYPLFADEVSTHVAEPDEAPQVATQVAPLHFTEPAPARPRHAAGTLAVAGAVLLLVGIALLGWNLLGAHHGGGHSAARSASVNEAASKAPVLSASAPDTAPPAVDTQGHPVTYAASNMLDGKASTAWRMPGDGTGTTLTFTLSHPATITSVGLINGYAKSESGLDWYTGNRRILKVEWTFDDGTVVQQTLHGSRALQRISVPAVRTSRVKLRLLQVSQPGKGPARRDMTAISEVQIASR